MRGMPYNQASKSAEGKEISNPIVREALEQQAAMRPAQAASGNAGDTDVAANAQAEAEAAARIVMDSRVKVHHLGVEASSK